MYIIVSWLLGLRFYNLLAAYIYISLLGILAHHEADSSPYGFIGWSVAGEPDLQDHQA